MNGRVLWLRMIAGAASIAVALVAMPAECEEPAPARRAKPPKQPVPIHLSLGSGFFVPWDGDDGFDVSGMLHAGLGSDRFWVGGEFEYRRFEAELKSNYKPDMNTFALRFSFQYHPFPQAVVSPYVGISVGLVLNKVDDNHARGNPSDKVRSDVSGGTSMLGVAGAEVSLGTPQLMLFAEGRLGNTSDLWKRKGGNYQTDQIDGITAMGGLRFRF